ncbi:hypothetical protein [Streptomyces lomondensis]|nr:hypothetical protein [Streptomyces lomondensis]MCF0082862.1 hypothetical protein [Streptomyces lomondensis]
MAGWGAGDEEAGVEAAGQLGATPGASGVEAAGRAWGQRRGAGWPAG